MRNKILLATPKKNIDKDKNNEEDFRIVERILAGETNLFSILEKKYKRIIVTLIRRMIRNEDDVQDLTQETFIKAYKSLERFRFGFTFSSWLYKIASNTCIDFMRKKRFPTISLSQPISPDDDQVFEVEDESYSADLNMLAAERKKILMKAIDELPDNYKTIIRLRHEEELDYTEISKILKMPLGTVKAHLFRARKILLSKLKNQRELFVER